MNDKEIDNRIRRIKTAAWENSRKACYNEALQLISCVASVYYHYNTCYVDNDLEDMLTEIAKTLCLTDWGEGESRTVLFYDGVGLENRGLSFIYIKALVQLGYRLLYVTQARHKKRLSKTLQIVEQTGGMFIFLQERIPSIKTTKRILNIVADEKPGKAFFYALPNDSFAAVAFMAMPRGVHRYQINLTDHAFWLGVHAFDTCLEIRSYGASISAQFRNIDTDKLIVQPIYPRNAYEGEFLGLPFKRKEGDFVVFSGGALYKTIGKDGTYYQIVSRMLERYPKVRFWYAGSGECKEMDALLQKYPGRVYRTVERPDLLQVLMHCDLYLDTYPLSGGLMIQFAAMAGCVPLTLWAGEHISGYLSDDQAFSPYVATVDELFQRFDRLYGDAAYRATCSEQIKRCVMTEEQFVRNLDRILKEGTSAYPAVIKQMDISSFLELYRDRTSEAEFLKTIGSLRYYALARVMPFYYTLSLIKKYSSGGRV